MNEPTTADKPALTNDEVRARKYFKPSDVVSGFSYLQTLTNQIEVPSEFNFKPDIEVPAGVPKGFGLLIEPQMKRNDTPGEPQVMIGLIAALVPDFATVAADPKAANALEKALLDLYARKLKNTIAGAEEGETIVLPDTLEGFFERAGRGEGLKPFTAIVKDYLAGFKKQGWKRMTAPTLRNVLMSESYAKAQYPKIPQTIWLAIIDKMKADTIKLGNSGELFDSWKTGRAERTFDQIDEVDLSAFGIGAEGEATTGVDTQAATA